MTVNDNLMIIYYCFSDCCSGRIQGNYCQVLEILRLAGTCSSFVQFFAYFVYSVLVLSVSSGMLQLINFFNS